MPTANTPESYGSVAKTFHWLTALGILTVIPLGIIANDMPYDTAEQLSDKAWLFSLHKTIGVTLFFVALARIAWALSQPKPTALHPNRKVETLLAEIVHWLLYGSLLLVPLSGWVHHAATEGFAPIWWPLGQNLPLVPENLRVAETAAGLHLVFERVLVISLLLHIAGAIKHTVIDKDGTLARMLPGRTAKIAGPQPHRPGFVPPVLAVLVWAAALGVGSMLGVYQKGDAIAAPAPELAEVDSEWVVTDGTLGITVRQMGADVSGRFEDWTADIQFDETRTDGISGRVDVEIAITSLTLGSVTQQAMGPDYFASAEFPTARFSADILKTADGYTADGTLTLRGLAQPISLPFDLTVDGNLAQMQGSAVLDRRNFEIGQGMTDAGQLGFEVNVSVDLTAERGAVPSS
ncbi:cytochrome b/b6 domain-containing protein [Marivita sp. XM-24bin2]|jgi:cytochrome b561/polyisoprenoid-binding protein YceI|uniref:cytochrome b/b6 domain-containing protein n=1 Tax=unclassified Marivita TaxID=2632480 RepID=UPI000D7A054D|nr:cytochrome b/b6 domain-containing protein [Marivita sp. XM-24bin2]MCR9108700.1 cytochrome b/b6 domain-containing protein [Paracoccaceae bacterium]PWL34174.1 MAG: cytochrome [Marivita sp. XM-24bin2]